MRENEREMLKLKESFADLQSANKDLSDLVYFLSLHDRNDIVIYTEESRGIQNAEMPFWKAAIYSYGAYVIKYLYNLKVHRVKTFLDKNGGILKLIDNSSGTGIFEYGNRYFALNLASEEFIEIPKPAFVLEKELAEKKVSAKKKAEKSK